MITKINRKGSLQQFSKLPLREWNEKEEEEIDIIPKTVGTYVLTVTSKTNTERIKKIVKQIKSLGYQHLVFQCDTDRPWRHRDTNYKPAKKALQYLIENNIGKKFNGALVVHVPVLQTFIQHLYSLTKTNTITSYVYFTDPEQNFIATFCQYGNLHLSSITVNFDKALKKIIAETELENVTTNCYDAS